MKRVATGAALAQTLIPQQQQQLQQQLLQQQQLQKQIQGKNLANNSTFTDFNTEQQQKAEQLQLQREQAALYGLPPPGGPGAPAMPNAASAKKISFQIGQSRYITAEELEQNRASMEEIKEIDKKVIPHSFIIIRINIFPVRKRGAHSEVVH